MRATFAATDLDHGQPIPDAASHSPLAAASTGDGEHDAAAVDEPSTAVTSQLSEENASRGNELKRNAILRRLLLQSFNSNDDNVTDIIALDPEAENQLMDILEAVSEELQVRPSFSGVELPRPHFPVGDWSWAVCQVCLEQRWLYRRPCCQLPVCNDCLKVYLSIKVNEGVVKIECCGPKCRAFVHRDEISARMDAEDKMKFHQRLEEANSDPWLKTCPRCSHVTQFAKVKTSRVKNSQKRPFKSRVICCECGLWWCFSCHAPWHSALTCRQYRKGDRLMKSWANQMQQGQLNAQKCPRCQAYIQRSTGCDHMHCIRCKTDFCYRCGDRLRKLRFFGDHYSKLSVFGCKYRYKADKPLQRKLVRAAVFGSKLMIVPLLGTLGACACVVALGFGVFILPVYGGLRLYNLFSSKHAQHQLMSQL